MSETPSISPRRAAAGIAILSLSLLFLEVSATRLLSFVSWHHFAFMVVSVAMLGLGTAAVALSVIKRLREVSLDSLCTACALLLAVTIVIAYAILVWARFSPVQLAGDPGQFGRLAATYVALLLPFIVGGVAVAATLSRMAKQASLLYGADLIGAALGCLAGIWLAGPFSLEQAFLVSGVLACASGAIYAWPRRSRALLCGAAGVVFAIVAWQAERVLPARAAPGKELSAVLEEMDPPGQVLTTRNTPLGRVDLVSGQTKATWSYNPRVEADIPPHLHFIIDGSAATPVSIIGQKPIGELDYLKALPTVFVFPYRKPERVLVIGAGGGQDVLAALYHGARAVDAVEINPAIVSQMKGHLLEKTGKLYTHPNVRVVQAEGRSFVRSSPGTYDVIQLGLVDTWAASSSGGLSLTENFLYTVDAFDDYLNALRPGGVVSISRWIRKPRREMLRLAVLAVAALRSRGVSEPARHLAIVGLESLGTLLVGRDPIDPDDAGRIASLARQYSIDVHWLPDPDWPSDETFKSLMDAESLDDFVAAYPYPISPVTDDCPFFFDFNVPKSQSTVGLLLDPARAVMSGNTTVVAVLIQAVILSMLLLILPVAMKRVTVGASGRKLLAYFCMTGTGFMFLEVPLLQRLTLVVGHPVHAVALVLGVLLCSSGVASLFSNRLTGTSRSRIRIALLALAVLGAAEAATGAWISRACLLAPDWLRPLLAAAMVVPLGALMGLATPHGLRVAGHIRSDLTAMCWAVTSFASVVGSVLSVALSLHLGFGVSMAAGAACYLLAAGLAPGLDKRETGQIPTGEGEP